MGLIKEGAEIAVLTDILGDEDHLGDMDFKVAGSENGITAIQMDIKISEVTKEVMKQALAQAKDGRLHILGKMSEAIKVPPHDHVRLRPPDRGRADQAGEDQGHHRPRRQGHQGHPGRDRLPD